MCYKGRFVQIQVIFFRRPRKRICGSYRPSGHKKTISGLTMSDVKELVFELADKNNIPHTFNKEKKI